MTPAERAQAWASHLADAAERTFTRGAISVTVHSADYVEIGPNSTPAVQIRMTVSKAGKTIRRPENDWIVINPPTMVADGTAPNPNHDPSNPRSKPTRTAHRSDVREAFRQVLEAMVAG